MSYTQRFDARLARKAIVGWIREYFIPIQGHKAIIGISGGKDSTIAAALCCEALGKENVIGVLMPNVNQHDFNTALMVCKILDIKSLEFNISKLTNAIYNFVDEKLGDSEDNAVPKPHELKSICTDVPSRTRMITLYAVSAFIGGRVVCTSNASEIFTGNTAKWGDSTGDFAPLAMYTVTELIAIGDIIDYLPKEFSSQIS